MEKTVTTHSNKKTHIIYLIVLMTIVCISFFIIKKNTSKIKELEEKITVLDDEILDLTMKNSSLQKRKRKGYLSQQRQTILDNMAKSKRPTTKKQPSKAENQPENQAQSQQENESDNDDIESDIKNIMKKRFQSKFSSIYKEMLNDLNLSPEKQKQLTSHLAQNQLAHMEVLSMLTKPGSKVSDDDIQKKYLELKQEQQKNLDSILTPSEQKIYEDHQKDIHKQVIETEVGKQVKATGIEPQDQEAAQDLMKSLTLNSPVVSKQLGFSFGQDLSQNNLDALLEQQKPETLGKMEEGVQESIRQIEESSLSDGSKKKLVSSHKRQLQHIEMMKKFKKLKKQ